MTRQVLRHQGSPTGLQQDVNKGERRGQLEGRHQIFLQQLWSAAGHAVWQKSKQKGKHMQAAKRISMTVEAAIHALHIAQPLSTKSLRTA